MTSTQSFVPSFTDEWTASFENPRLLRTGKLNGFYYDGNINIGFGYNLTGNGAAARSALAAVGLTFTNAHWKLLMQYVASPSKANTKKLTKTLGTTITISQALQLLDNYDQSIVVPALQSKIVNFGSLPALTQTALEDVYYDHATLLGPKTYSAAAADNLVGVCEQLCFDTTALSKVSSKQSGLEERFLGDGLLAIGVVATYAPNHTISSLDESSADPSDVAQFLKDVLVGTNSLGSGGVSANDYVKLWGNRPETSYANSIFALDQYLIPQGEYVASTDASFANIDKQNITMPATSFTLINAISYSGTLFNFVSGDTIDLTDIGTATQATLGAGNVLTINGSSNITLQLDPNQNYSGLSFSVSSDGNGGTDVGVGPSKTTYNYSGPSFTYTYLGGPAGASSNLTGTVTFNMDMSNANGWYGAPESIDPSITPISNPIVDLSIQSGAYNGTLYANGQVVSPSTLTSQGGPDFHFTNGVLDNWFILFDTQTQTPYGSGTNVQFLTEKWPIYTEDSLFLSSPNVGTGEVGGIGTWTDPPVSSPHIATGTASGGGVGSTALSQASASLLLNYIASFSPPPLLEAQIGSSHGSDQLFPTLAPHS